MLTVVGRDRSTKFVIVVTIQFWRQNFQFAAPAVFAPARKTLPSVLFICHQRVTCSRRLTVACQIETVLSISIQAAIEREKTDELEIPLE